MGRRHVSRRRLLKGAGIAAAATAATVAWPLYSASTRPNISTKVTGSGASEKPNVLLIITDDQPLHTEWATPTAVSWVAGQGIRFRNAHATTPLCAPSRASIFSGRYAHNHRVLDNGHPSKLDQNTTVQRQLQQAGYRTALFGKYVNNWGVKNPPPHFDEWTVVRPRYVDAHYNVDGVVQMVPGYTTTVLKNRLLGFLDRAAADSRPWFAVFTPNAPHRPSTADAPYEGSEVPSWSGRPSVLEKDKRDKPPFVRSSRYTFADGEDLRARQLQSLRSVDDALQAVRGKLVETGQLDNTLVIYCSDHGYLWADHALLDKALPYGPAHQVPLYLSWPAAGLDSGTVDDRIAANIDLAPTILDAVQVAPTTPQDGRSLLSNFRREHILLESWRWSDDVRGGRPTWASYLSTTRQYVEYYDLHTNSAGDEVGSGRIFFREYYDLTRDPYQLDNLLHHATPAGERALEIPSLAKQLAADRSTSGRTTSSL
ncbi:sulfatase [Actinopolymorpha sp. B11F2]|uniref:sulfatase family protein n=1 Tax=Actinopolymorpha sp. B11F2 TaxID=3160862 RepID=UPI0032E3BBBF